MTGDPNQQTRHNIFGEDQNYSVPNPEWNRFSGNNFYMQSNFPFCSNFGPAPVTFPIHSNSKNGNCFGPMYNYQANSSNIFSSPTSSTSNGNFNMQVPYLTESTRLKCKRKQDSDILRPGGFKQHITEEKMAEHMSKLHISSETPVQHETESELTQRLYMCEEMKKLQCDSILPPSLLNRLNKPCTALVVWQPPQPILPALGEAQQDENVDNNNEEEVPDHNLMDLV